MYPVARYLGIDAHESPTVTVDGDLVFLSDTTGTPQVWTATPGGCPERLTAHDERVSTVAASPTRREVVFGMDAGGDEHDQLYRYDLADGSETQLTDDPDVIHDWGAWSPDGDRVAYAANRREADAFDAYVQDRAGGEPTLVAEGEGGFLGVAAWGSPGIVLHRAHASFDNDLWLADPDGGGRRRLTDDEPARYAEATFGPDGDLYCLTDRGADTAYVGRFDRETGELSTVLEGGDWDVDHLAVHAETGRVAWSRNVDGYSEVWVGDLDDDGVTARREVDLGDGVVSELTVGPDGEQVVAAVSATGDPPGVVAVDAATGDAGEWTRPGTLGIPPESFEEPETVRYETFDGREIPAYFTLPADAEPGATPVVVDVHGGPEHQRRPWFYPVKQYLLGRGYAVLEPNVRGSSGYGRRYAALDDVEKRMDSVRDVEAAVDWVTDREAVDPDRVVAYGRSYGGFMVLAAVTEYPDLWAAAVEFVGIANFVTFLENTGDWRQSHREAEYGSLDGDREFLESVSPIHAVDRIECPLFIQHGANDPRVPVGETEQIAAALRERGVPVESLVFDDEGHHTTDRENRVEQFERVAAFLDEHV